MMSCLSSRATCARVQIHNLLSLLWPGIDAVTGAAYHAVIGIPPFSVTGLVGAVGNTNSTCGRSSAQSCAMSAHLQVKVHYTGKLVGQQTAAGSLQRGLFDPTSYRTGLFDKCLMDRFNMASGAFHACAPGSRISKPMENYHTAGVRCLCWGPDRVRIRNSHDLARKGSAPRCPH